MGATMISGPPPLHHAVVMAVLASSAIAVIVGTLLIVPAVNPQPPVPTVVSCCPGSGPPPLGTAFALSTPSEALDGPHDWYNFTVESAGAGIVFGYLAFQLQTASGTVLTPENSWTITALGIAGTVIGAYLLSTGAWVAGANATVTSGDVLSLDSAGYSLSGDTLLAVGLGYYQGSISVAIP
ncbi:MAG: hypothetical protein L3J91_00355 [Thermoplasmata archaeon]|nr:hypothetical protein [Thermoplasmata archaeon]